MVNTLAFPRDDHGGSSWIIPTMTRECAIGPVRGDDDLILFGIGTGTENLGASVKAEGWPGEGVEGVRMGFGLHNHHRSRINSSMTCHHQPSAPRDSLHHRL